MHLFTFPNGPLGSNMYVIQFDSEYILVDPSVDPNKIISTNKFPRDFFSRINAILLTHAHFDHVLYIDKWVELTECPVYLSNKDSKIMTDPLLNCSSQMYADISFNVKTTDVDDKLICCNNYITVINTPGHTPGSVCYLFDKDRMLFSGDTLFARSVGRADLPLGDSEALCESISILKKLDSDIIVYPGHGFHTKIGIELTVNPFFNS